MCVCVCVCVCARKEKDRSQCVYRRQSEEGDREHAKAGGDDLPNPRLRDFVSIAYRSHRNLREKQSLGFTLVIFSSVCKDVRKETTPSNLPEHPNNHCS